MTNLFEEFKKVSDQEWLDKIEADLKGKTANEIARKKVFEDLDLKVFYSASDVTEDTAFHAQSDWKIITDKDFFESVMADPINYFATRGNWISSKAQDLKEYKEVFVNESEAKNIGINGLIYNLAGASAIQELACIIGHLNEYFHTLKEDNKLDHDVLQKVSLKIGIGSDFFMEIAKFRSIRILVRNLAKAYELNTEWPIQIYAENSIINYSSEDIDTNILRSTTACMSAIMGSSDHLIINPHDELREGMHEFGNRIARNLQLMMKHEGHLDKVVDPASGSYFVENLTTELCKKAWNLFKEMEAQGGFIESLEKGTAQEMIKETALKRIARFKEGKDMLIGINKFRLNDQILDKGKTEEGKEEHKALQPLILEKHL